MIEASRLAIDPLIGLPVLTGFTVIAALAWLAYAILGGKAWLGRAVLLCLALTAVLNPSLVDEDREPLPSVVALVLDRSDSMSFGDRADIAQEVFDALQQDLATREALEVRVTEVPASADGTHLLGALQGLMADVPRDQIAGSILITDGQVHDAPDDVSLMAELGPVHTLLTGDTRAGDRRISLVDTPDFGIVGETNVFRVRVDDPDGGRTAISVAVNGGREEFVFVDAGTEAEIPIQIERRGDNIVVFETPAGRQELTLTNNRSAATISGIRDGLRVLLVTGRPNTAGRVWRDLLKSDPSVDLVHFTILRPPYKQDLTPLEEMALIAFPTEELFEEKLDSFDLVIFDQYERRGVITMAYLSGVAAYVANGGALLIVAGEDFSGPASLARTPLAGVLPALPSGEIRTGPLVPEISDAGQRHTVTQGLDATGWGRWLRYVEAVADTGDVLLQTPQGAPLLAVDRVGDGRVGLLLSDQIWLWARGYDGGGPFADLIRRLVHWLMKEPELDERRLELIAGGDTLQARLRTLATRAPPLSIETPQGAFLEPLWQEQRPGTFVAEVPVDQLGLYRARAGGLETVTLNGPANPIEYAELAVSPDRLKPLADATGGGVYMVQSLADLPELKSVSRRARTDGVGWLGLRDRGAYVVRRSESLPLMPGLGGMMMVILGLVWIWRREGQ